ncbi:probable drug/proton antiporter Yhk8p [Trichomonascus vanleenenianus]|uniref:MFS transporter n=1 Tax=Trichomonascus vanleenenianus TaxID=2268995 RepID=UPI003ECB2BBD
MKSQTKSNNSATFSISDAVVTVSCLDRNPQQEKPENVQTKTEDNSSIDPYLVDWDGIDDKENLKLSSKLRRWVYTILLTCAAFNLSMLSSVWSTTSDSIQSHFETSHEKTVLGISLFVLSFSIGPLFIAPLSEFYGRKPVYAFAYAGYLLSQVMTAFGRNIETLVIGRFFSGMFGSVFLSNVPGTIADLFENHELSMPMTIYTIGPFVGPGIGPVIGGYIDQYAGFRWVFYVFLIYSGVLAVLILTIVPETYPPILKAKKAKRLRTETGDDQYYAPFDKADKRIISAIRGNCTRPFLLLTREPMVLLLCFYTAFLLAIVYFFFVAFPIVFKNVYKFQIHQVGLSFLGLTFGMLLAPATAPIWLKIHARAKANNNGISEPEMRLPQMCIGGMVVPIGLFFFGWTIYPSVHWMAPIVAGGVFGLGCNWTFTGIMSYIVEAYQPVAASAMAANVLLRGVVACVLPLVGSQMLSGMGYHWAISLIGFISIALCPSGFMLFKYGKSLRAKSRFAV